MAVLQVSRYWARKCRNTAACAEVEPHTHHLTWFGRLYFTRYRKF